jgi:VIT1/CCC1 family predicted Fe2+/Mn2+ transporter
MPRVEKARKAYEKRDFEMIREAHEKERIEEEPWHDVARGRYIGDIIYGASDGIVTTFAIVAGATGAFLSSAVILILGFANLLADGLSMAAGNYLGTKSEIEYSEKERERETWEIENIPDAEREEIHQIFRRKGLTSHLAEKLAEIITSNKKVWIDVMMTEELGIISSENISPWKSALATFFSFLTAGFMPLLFFVLSYAFNLTNVFVLSTITTVLSLFVVGALRVKVTGRNWLRSGFEMLLVGGMAAAVAYIVGFLLRMLVG